MKETVNFYRFCDAFKEMNRDNNFSYEGKRALFDYLEEYERSTGEDIELDIIALCCEYSEYESLEAFQKDYNDEYKSVEDIEDFTQVIRIDDKSFIIQCF